MASYSLPHLYVQGSNYEIGLRIGIEFEKRIKTYLNGFDDFNTKLVPFIRTTLGQKIINDYRCLIEANYPWLIQEMKGISDGANIDFNQILALNFRVELFQYLKDDHFLVDNDMENLMECSDFVVSNEKHSAVLHNEDSLSIIYETGYMVSCKIKPTEYNGLTSPAEEFTSYCYPGHLAGNAFSYNTNGFVFGVNALMPKCLSLKRFPRQILSRLMLSAECLSQLEDIIRLTPMAFGFSLTVGFFGDDLKKTITNWNDEYGTKKSDHFVLPLRDTIWNYEIAINKNATESNVVSKHCVIPSGRANDDNFYSIDHYYHFNHYERVNIEQLRGKSSSHRRNRAEQIAPPQTPADLLNFAYDTKDEEFPIYRERKQGEIGCVATGLYCETEININMCLMCKSKQTMQHLAEYVCDYF